MSYDSEDDVIFNNRTESTILGARLDAPVLNMDFNEDEEAIYGSSSLYYDGKIDTHSYSSKMDTYHKRLAEIEERLINMQAEKEMKRSGFPKGYHGINLNKKLRDFNIFKKKQAEHTFFPKFKLEHKKKPNKIIKSIKNKLKKLKKKLW